MRILLTEDELNLGAAVQEHVRQVYISRIRRKLGRDFVRTVRGLGYRIRS